MTKLNTFKLVFITLLLTFFYGCASLNNHNIQLSGTQYLKLAQQSQGQKKQYYQLQAAHAFLNAGDINHATQLSSTLNKVKLPNKLSISLKLLQAQLALTNQHNNQAIDLLQAIHQQHALLPPNQQIQFYNAFAKAYENSGDVISSIIMRQKLGERLRSYAQKKQNAWKTWQTLQILSKTKLAQETAQTTSPYLKGWLKFTLLTKKYDSDPTTLINQLTLWRNEFPDHPANLLLPQNLQQVASQPLPQKIALLLPLSGRFAPYGRAIKNGFFTAYYSLKKRHGFAPKLTFFDTNKKNINTLYQQAVTQGAQFIIGPLRKENVNALEKNQHRTTPVLALNTTPTAAAQKPPFYEFGLSPTLEAARVADKARKNQQQNIAVIAPSSAWGTRVANAFIKRWEQLGGKITRQQTYTNQRGLSADIRKLLGINQAYKDKHKLQHILKEKIRYVPRRRKDFDAIFLVATPKNARQIKPLLRFYFAGNVQVYAISATFSPNYDKIQNNDLNGVLFCDMPWILTPGSLEPAYLNNIQQRTKALWPSSYKRYHRFFALGVDALQILKSIPKMTTLPNLGVQGATGTLFLMPDDKISRALTFATIQNGKVTVVQ